VQRAEAVTRSLQPRIAATAAQLANCVDAVGGGGGMGAAGGGSFTSGLAALQVGSVVQHFHPRPLQLAPSSSSSSHPACRLIPPCSPTLALQPLLQNWLASFTTYARVVQQSADVLAASPSSAATAGLALKQGADLLGLARAFQLMAGECLSPAVERAIGDDVAQLAWKTPAPRTSS
jgi:hypothetical protein